MRHMPPPDPEPAGVDKKALARLARIAADTRPRGRLTNRDMRDWARRILDHEGQLPTEANVDELLPFLQHLAPRLPPRRQTSRRRTFGLGR